MSLYLQFQSFLTTPRRSCRSSSSSFSSSVAVSSSPWLAPSSLAGGSAGSEDTEVSFGIYYGDVIMGTIASQITSLTIVYSTVYSDADQRKHQSSASLTFVRGIHIGPVNSPHKQPVTRKMFSFDDVIMRNAKHLRCGKIVNLHRKWLFMSETVMWTEHLFALNIQNSL